MQTFTTERLRNVALVGHNGVGKTSLGEALLFTSGANTRMGSIEDGNTTSDYEPEAVKRGGSIQLGVLPCPWNDHKVNLLDTPGYFDFLGDVISALRVADAAVLVLAANAGVEVGSEQMWGLIRNQGLPTVIVVNKMDRENADFYSSVASARKSIGKQCIPIQIPIGSAQDFQGVIDLLPKPKEIPAELEDQFAEAREALSEAIAETDDELANKYLEGNILTDEELATGLKSAVALGQLVPMLASSATQATGTKELLDAIVTLLPPPNERPIVQATNSTTGQPEALEDNGPLAALVFKTTADPFVGKLSFLRVYSGALSSNTEVWNVNRGQTERLAQLFVPRGKSQDTVPSLVVGDIGAIGKLTVSGTGDTLGQREHPLTLEGLEFPPPTFTLTVAPKAKADSDKMGTALARLVEEDPSLRFTRDNDTGDSLLSGLGDTHIEVAIQRAQRKFSVNLLTETPRVPYKETITNTARIEHRHKQQSGGHGHFAHIMLRLEPLGRGGGIEYGVEVVGGSVPRDFFPAVEKGVRRACAEGAVAGYPLVDVKVVLYDGSYHPVDSASMDFDIAGYFGLKKAVEEGKPVLLEPVLLLKVTVPDVYTGDVIGDLNSKRGRILGMVPNGDGTTTVEAHAPQEAIQRYALELRSMTQARGSFTVEPDHYQEVPPLLQKQVIEQAKPDNKATSR